jgi:hypothetical protein
MRRNRCTVRSRSERSWQKTEQTLTDYVALVAAHTVRRPRT